MSRKTTIEDMLRAEAKDDVEPEECMNCRFWGAFRDEVVPDKARCRRFPPMAHKDKGALWPLTRPYSWCGEYQRVEDEAVD